MIEFDGSRALTVILEAAAEDMLIKQSTRMLKSQLGGGGDQENLEMTEMEPRELAKDHLRARERSTQLYLK
uniref:Uncharacterized protein n=1 Tax=Peronospora matthiolae TaxID=2874970 RepID=A0AAV1UFI0_9STRA